MLWTVNVLACLLFIVAIINLYIYVYRKEKYKVAPILLLYVFGILDLSMILLDNFSFLRSNLCQVFWVFGYYGRYCCNMLVALCITTNISMLSIRIRALIQVMRMENDIDLMQARYHASFKSSSDDGDILKFVESRQDPSKLEQTIRKKQLAVQARLIKHENRIYLSMGTLIIGILLFYLVICIWYASFIKSRQLCDYHLLADDLEYLRLHATESSARLILIIFITLILILATRFMAV